MLMLKNELISSIVMATLVSILVLMNLPASSYLETDYKKRPFTIGVRAFILSFLATYAIFYFISDPPKSDVMSNVIPGEPDF